VDPHGSLLLRSRYAPRHPGVEITAVGIPVWAMPSWHPDRSSHQVICGRTQKTPSEGVVHLVGSREPACATWMTAVERCLDRCPITTVAHTGGAGFTRHSPVSRGTGKVRKSRDGETAPDPREQLPSPGCLLPYSHVEKLSFRAIRTGRFGTSDIGNSTLARHPGRAWTRATGERQQFHAVPPGPHRAANG